MPRRLSLFRLLLPVLTGALILGLTGCGDSDRLSYASELDEPNYREGQSLLKAGRRQEALAAFLKVVDKRREDAPESHLEAGLLYAQHINDPLSAIYHFRKYLALRPNSPQAPLVRQRIDAAIREFARTIPAQPLENQVQRVDLIATLDRLKQENEALKQQLADARAGRSAAPEAAVPGGEPADDFKFSLETLPTVRTRPADPSPRQVVPAPAPARATTVPSAPVSATGRRHVVRPGDTLSKLSQQYYGTRAKWRDIYTANLGVMRSASDLKIGMELKIP